MSDLAQNGDIKPLASHKDCALPEGMKSLAQCLRPVIKRMIVGAALHGTITKERARELIKQNKLEAL